MGPLEPKYSASKRRILDDGEDGFEVWMRQAVLGDEHWAEIVDNGAWRKLRPGETFKPLSSMPQVETEWVR